MEQNSTRCHSSAEQDTLYIETEKAEFEIIYRLCSVSYTHLDVYKRQD